MTSVLKRDYGNRARYLASQNYERLHVYATHSALMADVSTASGRVAYVVATDTVYVGQSGTWIALPSGLGNGLNFLGAWNANTNSPTVVSSTGTLGQFYKVSVAGSTAIDGNSTWNVGDILLFDGSTWDRILGPNSSGGGGGGGAGQLLESVADQGSASAQSGSFTLGQRFMPLSALTCSGVQVNWLGAATTLDIKLWDHTGAVVGSGTMTVTGTPGIFSGTFGSPIVLTPGALYTVSYSDTAGSPQFTGASSSLVLIGTYSPPGYLYQGAWYQTGLNTYPAISSTGYLIDPLFS